MIGLTAFVILGGVAPFATNKYILNSVLDYFLIYVALAESYDILGGLMGYVDLGITVYFGAGAYGFAILYHVLHWVAPQALVVAVLFSGFLGLLVSFPMFRLRGFYFAVATLALVPLGQYIVLAPSLGKWTNGVGGISGFQANSVEAYYGIFAFAVFSIILVFAISRSRLGLALTSIREDEQVAESSGINTRLTKKIAMVICATLSGVSGCLFAWSQGTILPSVVFSLYLAFIPVTFALFGGTGTVMGPIIGTGVYSLLDFVLHSSQVQNSQFAWLSSYEQALVGLFLIVVGLFAPDGILGLSRRIYRRQKTRKLRGKELADDKLAPMKSMLEIEEKWKAEEKEGEQE
ncbi:MAG TPA: branched-chain amino acid ABC transporter permease [Nitrososphaerales archaeon]|nr:branched-chain amino acid ABC transporter permease [Nitrososphaerales archaeon]